MSKPAPKPAPQPPPSIEYGHLTAAPEDIPAYLNTAQKEGWQLVSIHPLQGFPHFIAYLQRPALTSPSH